MENKKIKRISSFFIILTFILQIACLGYLYAEGPEDQEGDFDDGNAGDMGGDGIVPGFTTFGEEPPEVLNSGTVADDVPPATIPESYAGMTADGRYVVSTIPYVADYVTGPAQTDQARQQEAREAREYLEKRRGANEEELRYFDYLAEDPNVPIYTDGTNKGASQIVKELIKDRGGVLDYNSWYPATQSGPADTAVSAVTPPTGANDSEKAIVESRGSAEQETIRARCNAEEQYLRRLRDEDAPEEVIEKYIDGVRATGDAAQSYAIASDSKRPAYDRTATDEDVDYARSKIEDYALKHNLDPNKFIIDNLSDPAKVKAAEEIGDNLAVLNNSAVREELLRQAGTALVQDAINRQDPEWQARVLIGNRKTQQDNAEQEQEKVDTFIAKAIEEAKEQDRTEEEVLRDIVDAGPAEASAAVRREAGVRLSTLVSGEEGGKIAREAEERLEALVAKVKKDAARAIDIKKLEEEASSTVVPGNQPGMGSTPTPNIPMGTYPGQLGTPGAPVTSGQATGQFSTTPQTGGPIRPFQGDDPGAFYPFAPTAGSTSTPYYGGVTGTGQQPVLGSGVNVGPQPNRITRIPPIPTIQQKKNADFNEMNTNHQH